MSPRPDSVTGWDCAVASDPPACSWAGHCPSPNVHLPLLPGHLAPDRSGGARSSSIPLGGPSPVCPLGEPPWRVPGGVGDLPAMGFRSLCVRPVASSAARCPVPFSGGDAFGRECACHVVESLWGRALGISRANCNSCQTRNHRVAAHRHHDPGRRDVYCHSGGRRGRAGV